MTYQVTELPLEPEGATVAVVLYHHDEPFNEAVCGWGLRWNTRVACWLASGQPYGVVISNASGCYEKLFTAHDDESFESAIDAALEHLGNTRCHWRIPAVLRSPVRWRISKRQHVRHEALRRAEREAQRASA